MEATRSSSSRMYSTTSSRYSSKNGDLVLDKTPSLISLDRDDDVFKRTTSTSYGSSNGGVRTTSSYSTSTRMIGGGSRDSTLLRSERSTLSSLSSSMSRRDSSDSNSSVESSASKVQRRMNMEKSYDYQAMIDSADQVDLAFELRKTTTLLETRYVPVYSKRFFEAAHKLGRQDYESLKNRCLIRNKLFVDEEFRANDSSLAWADTQEPTSVNGYKLKRAPVIWMRPHQICLRSGITSSDYKRRVDDHDGFDLLQGDLDDSWLLSTLACLDKKQRRQIIPKHQRFGTGYAGIFKFRFWRFGDWEEVIIDDRLPTRNQIPIYLRSREPNEFWSSLIEKGYAKFYGSYQALTSGLASEAAVDLTGGIPEKIDLTTTKLSDERVFTLLNNAYSKGALIACSIMNSQLAIEAQEMGLQTTHTYAVTNVVTIKVRNVDQGIHLVKLRNPLGSKEWKGMWSDDDKTWKRIPTDIQDKLKLVRRDDGEFFMSFRDFVKYFGLLEITHRPAEEKPGPGNSRLQAFKGEWRRRKANCGGSGLEDLEDFARNPQYFFDADNPEPSDELGRCPIIISLAQKQNYGKPYLNIGFKVYKVLDNAKSLDATFLKRNTPIGRSGPFTNYREVSQRLMLPKGRYCVIPCTYEQGKEGDFLLRLLFERDWHKVSMPIIESVKDQNTNKTEYFAPKVSYNEMVQVIVRRWDEKKGEFVHTNEFQVQLDEKKTDAEIAAMMFPAASGSSTPNTPLSPSPRLSTSGRAFNY